MEHYYKDYYKYYSGALTFEVGPPQSDAVGRYFRVEVSSELRKEGKTQESLLLFPYATSARAAVLDLMLWGKPLLSEGRCVFGPMLWVTENPDKRWGPKGSE